MSTRNPTPLAHPHLWAALAVGVAVYLALPSVHTMVSRALVAWNAAVWLYLALMAWTMHRADAGHLQRRSVALAETMGTVLLLVSLSAVASLVGIVALLAGAKVPAAAVASAAAAAASSSLVAAPQGPTLVPHVALALATVAGAWLLLPVMFALSYASLYWRATQPGPGAGLRFPDDDPAFRPNYADFLYFSFTIAVAAQTADVSVTTPRMRRLVLMQALLSFVFNTAILALTINIAAGLV